MCESSFQDLKGKILLKAKKIGGLEENINGMVDDSMTTEVSDEDEGAEIDDDNLHRESIIRRVKVGQVVQQSSEPRRSYIQSSEPA